MLHGNLKTTLMESYMTKKKKETLRREKNFGSVYQNKYGK